MISQWSAWLHTLRRWCSRNEWGIWLLRLPKSQGTAAEPGLVLVQIDGLSQRQLQSALDAGRMPFLRRLLANEGYQLHTFYSGLPSSTPAVQGELFYGQKCAVPAFSFRDSQTEQVVRMYFHDPAARVEQRLAEQGDGLLQQGSAYCDNYSGGTEEAHFCASTVGWGGVLKAANPLTIVSLLLSHGGSLLRVAVLMAIELVLAVIDCCRGLIAGRDLRKELMLVPGRVTVGVLLRELVTIGTTIDIARGLPIIHLNFLGYDEQAHRRGPSSRFAHWSLQGIDHAIGRIWRAAQRSTRREYDVWIYSDHGQEELVQYHRQYGRTIQQAVAAVLGEHSKLSHGQLSHWQLSHGQLSHGQPSHGRRAGSIEDERPSRAMWLSAGRLTGWLFGDKATDGEDLDDAVTVAAMGPVGFVYPQRQLTAQEKEELASALVEEADIPAVLVADDHDGATAFTSNGRYRLPEQAPQLLGSDYPFLADVGHDLVRLCRHADAGTFTLLGWRHDCLPLSFRIENGGHAGASIEETRAFALLPFDAPLPVKREIYLRPLDIRRAALHLLDRESVPNEKRVEVQQTDRKTLRIATYNVHHCIGMDGKLSPSRIARVIAQCDADVVAIQELDVRHRRSGDVDQAHEIARRLEMEFHFHPAWQIEEESFGNAVLSRYPMRLVHHDRLPGVKQPRRLRPRGFLQPRGALWVEISVGQRKVQLINTHLGLLSRERWMQVDALLGDQWLDHPKCREPYVLCGDFNSGPATRVFRRLGRRLHDAQTELAGHGPLSTWFGHRPMRRIDHVFYGSGMRVQRVYVPRSDMARRASDHLPLVVDLEFDP